jgi:hypothetical protein
VEVEEEEEEEEDRQDPCRPDLNRAEHQSKVETNRFINAKHFHMAQYSVRPPIQVIDGRVLNTRKM